LWCLICHFLDWRKLLYLDWLILLRLRFDAYGCCGRVSFLRRSRLLVVLNPLDSRLILLHHVRLGWCLLLLCLLLFLLLLHRLVSQRVLIFRRGRETDRIRSGETASSSRSGIRYHRMRLI
jgi:hypothetical protein